MFCNSPLVYKSEVPLDAVWWRSRGKRPKFQLIIVLGISWKRDLFQNPKELVLFLYIFLFLVVVGFCLFWVSESLAVSRPACISLEPIITWLVSLHQYFNFVGKKMLFGVGHLWNPGLMQIIVSWFDNSTVESRKYLHANQCDLNRGILWYVVCLK